VAQRLSDTYRAGDRVEIAFAKDEGQVWQPAIVLGFQHPGLWARTADGRVWFVTNTRRIRHLTTES
jgi:hypothetical protein